jgi:hypothetical protein
MSSPRAATKARRAAVNGKAKAAAKVVPVKPAPAPARGARPPKGLSKEAIRLAGEIELGLAWSDDVLSVEAMQKLMSALCRAYSAQVEGGARFTPIPEGQVVSPTGVMLTASGLLRAANLAVFELGMWQSWTGR